MEKKGYLDFRQGGRRYFIGDARYSASRNTSPGFSGGLTNNPANPPALVDVSGLGRRGYAAYLKAGSTPLPVTRRTGWDWPDDPLSKGKAFVSFDLYRKSGGEVLLSTLLNQTYLNQPPASTEQNVQLKIDGDGGMSVWNGKEWSAPAGSMPERVWTTVSLELDYTKGTYALALKGYPVGASGSFDSSKITFDGVGFAAVTGEVYVDNVKVLWSW